MQVPFFGFKMQLLQQLFSFFFFNLQIFFQSFHFFLNSSFTYEYYCFFILHFFSFIFRWPFHFSHKCFWRRTVEKIQANKHPNKTTKDIVVMLCTPRKLGCKHLQAKIISSKQIRDMQCIMLCFKNKMLYNKPYTTTRKTK